MPYVDCCTLVGNWPQAEVDLSLEALAAAMQARGVGRSLVTHTSAVFYDMSLGNDQVIQLCRQHAPLTPVAVLNALQYPRCLEEIRRCRDAGVQVFRLCPREHHYPFHLSHGPLREVLKALEGTRLLLVDLVGLPQPTLGAGIENLLPVPTAFSTDGAGLGMLLHGATQNRNVWIESSRLDAGGAIEAAVKYAGADRVVFGSLSPLRSLGSAVMTVQYAELSDADRNAIFEGNATRILA